MCTWSRKSTKKRPKHTASPNGLSISSGPLSSSVRRCLKREKSKEAISEFQEGIGLAPQNANMRYSLGLAYLKDGNKKSALTEFRKAAELAPKSDLARKANEYIKTLR